MQVARSAGPPARRPCPARGQRRQQRAVRPAAAAGSQPAIDALVEDLPIRAVIPDVLRHLDEGACLVLQAPPGAGKTTAVPLALLLHKPAWLAGGQTIVMLEPRRVAAKAAARRMASLLGEPVGRTVGYRVRLESRVSAATRIEVLTEGILLRRLQQDPTLEGVGALLLDEFHERSLDADTSLALALDCQAWARPDLRLLVMSATLGGGLAQDLQQLMASRGAAQAEGGARGSVPVVVSDGRSYPVTTHFLGRPLLQKRGELEAATTAAVLKALASPAAGSGDVLVFLPGVAELRRVQQLLQQEPAVARAGVQVQQLHGGLAPQLQDAVLRPRRGATQQRRVVLATPLAESSVTIDGVTAVVDSGLVRAPAFDPSTGISRLLTRRIALDSAEQRRGRAGRTQPGVCFRLWEREDEASLMLPRTPPEIESADLAPLALQLAAWGCNDAQELAWLDPPDPHALADGQALLRDLAALDERGRLTDTGRRVAAVPAHPRFAHMVLRAQRLGAAELGCVLAALLSERDLFRSSGDSGRASERSADLAARLRVLAGQDPPPTGFDRAAATRVLLGGQQVLRQLAAAAAVPEPQGTDSSDEPSSGVDVANTADELDEAESSLDEPEGLGSSAGASLAQRHASDAAFAAAWQEQLRKPGLLGALVAAAYPDRIAQAKPGSKASFSLSSGRVAVLPGGGAASDPLAASRYVAVAELRAGRDGRSDCISLAADLPALAISTYLSDEVAERTLVLWAPASKAVVAKRQRVLGSLVLAESPARVADEAALPVLLKGLSDGGWASLPIPPAAEAWRARAAWLHGAEVAASGSSAVPDLGTRHLLGSLAQWLGPHLAGVRSKAQLAALPWLQIFQGLMDWPAQQHVDACAPSHLMLPTGTRVAISYTGQQPKAAVKLQEVFGLADTPLLGGGACVPLLLELLSPAGRPLQVTANLASFWAESYTAVRKEMRGRYPKHPWPDDPAAAAPTRLTNKQLAAGGGGGGGSGSGGSAAGSSSAAPQLRVTSKKAKRR